MIAFCILPLQTIFATDVPILKKDDPDPGKVGIKSNSLISNYVSSIYVVPVTANLTDTELELNFIKSVGVVQISVTDENGSIVYQQAISTSITPDIDIATDGWDSGSYTLNITYSTITLTGVFQLY